MPAAHKAIPLVQGTTTHQQAVAHKSQASYKVNTYARIQQLARLDLPAVYLHGRSLSSYLVYVPSWALLWLVEYSLVVFNLLIEPSHWSTALSARSLVIVPGMLPSTLPAGAGIAAKYIFLYGSTPGVHDLKLGKTPS